MLSKTLLNNTPKKIKDVYKPLDEFEEVSEVNYYADYEIKKRKLKLTKKKSCVRKEFVEEK